MEYKEKEFQRQANNILYHFHNNQEIYKSKKWIRDEQTNI